MLQLKLFCTFLQTGWAVSFENPRSQNVWHANFSQVWVSKMTVDASMTLRSKKNWNQSRYNRKLADVLFEGLSVFPQRWIKSVHINFFSHFSRSFRISFQGKTHFSWRISGPIKFLQKSSGISPLARGIETAWKVSVKTMRKLIFGLKKRLQVGRDGYWSGHFWLRWKSLFE